MEYVPKKSLPPNITLRHACDLTPQERPLTTALIRNCPLPDSDRLADLVEHPDALRELDVHGFVALDQSLRRAVGFGFFMPSHLAFGSRSLFSQALFKSVQAPLLNARVDGNRLAYFAHFFVNPEYGGRGIGSHIFARRLALAKENHYTHALAVIERGNESSRKVFGQGIDPLTSFTFEGKLLDVFLRPLTR